MTTTAIAQSTGPSRQDLLGVYLNDHLAGATAGCPARGSAVSRHAATAARCFACMAAPATRRPGFQPPAVVLISGLSGPAAP